MNRSINDVLEAIKQTLAVEAQNLTLNKQALAETEGPSDAESVEETLESYVSDIVGNIVQTYEMTEEDALDLVVNVLEDLAKDGICPPMPVDEDTETAAIWLGTAKSLMLDSFIYDCMEEDSEEITEPGE